MPFTTDMNFDLTAESVEPSVHTEDFEYGTAVVFTLEHARMNLIGTPAELRRIAQEILELVPDPLWTDGVDLSPLDHGLEPVMHSEPRG